MEHFTLLLRRALGLSTLQDERFIHANGGPPAFAGTVLKFRYVIAAGAVVLGTSWLAGAAISAWERSLFTAMYLFPRWDAPRETILNTAHASRPAKSLARYNRLQTAREAHQEILKYCLGDPDSLFYMGDAPPLTPDAFDLLPEKRQAVQEIHDYWHTKYSDEIYRKVLKGGFVDALFSRYVSHLLDGGEFVLPDTYIRNLKPNVLWEVSSEIETSWLRSATAVESAGPDTRTWTDPASPEGPREDSTPGSR